MRSAQITVTVYGADAKTALERLFADLLDVMEVDDQTPVTVQARVALNAVVHAPDPSPIDRLDALALPAEERFIAEGKLWCRRPHAPGPSRLRVHKSIVPPLK